MSDDHAVLTELARGGALDGLRLPETTVVATKLQGHASRRSFYRLQTGTGAPRGELLIVYPEGQAEEVERYCRTAEWLRKADVRVPAIRARGRLALVVEDGGSSLLDGAPRDAGVRRRLYRQAVDVVVRIQAHGRRRPGPNPEWALDAERLYRELEFFEEHAARGWLGVEEAATERTDLYERLTTAVAALPTAECHRDFHSRNLLSEDGRLMVLDFQDLMHGPFLYDMASLIRDDYCALPAVAEGDLLQRFWARSARPLTTIDSAAVPALPRGLPPAARQAFCLVALQRGLKALGTFGYQLTVAANPVYARFAPRTRAHVLQSLELLGWEPASCGLAFLARRDLARPRR